MQYIPLRTRIFFKFYCTLGFTFNAKRQQYTFVFDPISLPILPVHLSLEKSEVLYMTVKEDREGLEGLKELEVSPLWLELVLPSTRFT
jgi:hypothetical protein